MKVLLTNFRLAERTGTECALMEIAIGLKARGHEVAVFTPEPGALAELLRNAHGIPVVAGLAQVPWTPDIIHGQHQVPTTLALLQFPSAPVLNYCHGYGPVKERPVRHPRVRRWLAPSTNFRDWFQQEFQIPPDRFVFAPNWVDTDRFPLRTLPQSNHKALLYHTSIRRGASVEALKEGCRAAGFEFAAVSYALGGGTDAPEKLLGGYDVVFTSGRSALEAMACGCAVIPVREGRLGDAITPENAEAALHLNFSVVSTMQELTPDAVRHVLQTLDATRLPALAARVRTELSLNAGLDRMEACYADILAEELPPPDLMADQAALHQALLTAAEALASSRQETARIREGWEETKRKRESLSVELSAVKQALAEVKRPTAASDPALWRMLKQRWSRLTGEKG